MLDGRYAPDFGLTKEQAMAIGRMAVAFNWMESAVEFLIEEIVSPHNRHLTVVLIENLRCGAKLARAKALIGALRVESGSSSETKASYERLASKLGALLLKAEKLNTFRNSLIHWRPFEERNGKAILEQNVDAIKARVVEIGDTTVGLLEVALLLRTLDFSLNWEAFRTLF